MIFGSCLLSPAYAGKVNRDFGKLINETSCIHVPIYLPWGNPAVVPEIERIIEKATQITNEEIPSSAFPQIPLDIALQIVDTTRLLSMADTRNMLVVFGWRLPDSYWKRCCDMDLIFEYDDLCKINSQVVDWQFVGLSTGVLLENPGWCHKGLKTRCQIFGLLRQINTIFLDLLEQGKKVETPHRRSPPRKGFL